MSSSAQGGSGGPEEKPQILAKFMRRASKVLKRGGSSRGSDSAVSDVPPVESRSTTAAKPTSAPLSGYVTFLPDLYLPTGKNRDGQNYY